ncbi:MAG: family metallopeptidase [Marmoricola sp.]|nr:family metallopeptidase [Marmoricola sp.]
MRKPGTARHGAALLVLLPLAACATVPATPGQPVDRARPATVGSTEVGGGDGELSPYDVDDPAIAHLDGDLRSALQHAASDADAAGVRFWVTSGWRSRTHQQRLLDEAVTRYGSLAAAERFVSTPDRSAHVRGDAADIGPTEADDWLARHGSRYGLCQSFANEIWHFELATSAGGTCPEPIPDSSYR